MSSSPNKLERMQAPEGEVTELRAALDSTAAAAV